MLDLIQLNPVSEVHTLYTCGGKIMGIQGHQNWYGCDGECEDPPRNKNFSHGFGSRYQFPLPDVNPNPSRADYSHDNVAALANSLGGILGLSEGDGLTMIYQNGTQVTHTVGGSYPNPCDLEKSPELKRYEEAAKRSALLKLYQQNSPAGIEYFQDRC